MIKRCTRTLEFSKLYATRAYQTQRSGPVWGSLPSLQEIDEILQVQQHNKEALLKIRDAVINQEQALANQHAQQQLYKSDHHHGDEDHTGVYQEDFKGGGGFAGADAKKRRGVSHQSPEPFEAVINIFHRKLLLLGVAIAVIEQKPPNGAVGRMVLVPCVTPVVCIMLS
jgi:hypothetical protein